MKVTYDSEADAIYIRFMDNRGTAYTRLNEADVGVDFDQDGKIVGIEILDSAERIANLDDLRQVEFEDIRANQENEPGSFEAKPRNGHELLEMLRQNGFVGMWADRTDIGDTLDFARKLRERASRRTRE